jgi:NADPH:quinone reductase-like Zn-dependent oxidoreductase
MRAGILRDRGLVLLRLSLVTMGFAISIGTAAAVPATDTTMQAVVVVDGKPEVQRVARPAPGSGQVLVKVYDAGINPVDWKIATGRAGAQPMGRGGPPGPPPPPGPASGAPTGGPPAIPGFDAAGVIETVGDGVSGYKVGDAVIVWSGGRATYAEYVAVAADTIAAKPAELSFAQAAAIGHASITAWNMLVDVVKLQTGQKVLVLGGSGGVGSTAIQIARNMGAHVIATASGAHLDYLRTLGAEEVIDYTQTPFETQVSDVDVVINTVDADNASRAVGVIRRGGWLVSLLGLPMEQCNAAGIQCSSRTMTGTLNGEVLRRLADWAHGGKFTVHIDRTFRLQEVAQAWEYSQARHTTGKSVIQLVP